MHSEYSRAVEPPDPDRVESLSDLVAFLEALSKHFAHEHQGDDWQNWNVGDYLESIARWLRDSTHTRAIERMDVYRPTWRDVATLFEVGRIYE